MDKKCEARRSLHQRADRGTAQPDDEVAFPMTRHGAVVSFGGTFADHDFGRYEGLPVFSSAQPWYAKRASSAQAGGQLAAQRASTLHIECLVDGFGADAHRFVIRKLVQEPPRDLLRAPRCCPPPVLPTPMSTSFPGHCRPMNSLSTWAGDNACQSILNVAPQRSIDGQLANLRPASRPFSVPLRRCGAINESTTASGRVTSNFT
jgi:hypothetical protein